MTANMYRVGDYVYFETSTTTPYQIRRIEELNKTQSGNVEAKVMCFYRRRDLPQHLVVLADKHQSALDDPNDSPISESSRSNEQLGPKQRHQMRHRELFLSRTMETLPATHIRGKCSVTLFNETEALSSYLSKEDMFFYCLVFDPAQKTLLADKGEIRVGSRYQCDIPPMLKDLNSSSGGGNGGTGVGGASGSSSGGEISDNRNLQETESLVWTPNHNLSDRQIDQFLVVSRSVGTFARALDCSSSVKQPSLHMSAAAASRDITLFHAMDTLHRHNYDLSSTLCSLVPSSGPVLCRDEMEEWSASEANLFEEALDKYGKDFTDIQKDFLPWKTIKNIVQYYYMWKTTDRYVQQKRVKAVEAESKLKQVYIPNYSKPNPAALNNNKGILNGSNNGSTDAGVSLGETTCISCSVTASSQWYAWGSSQVQYRICHQCWSYWKRYGGLKVPSRFGDGSDLDFCGKKRSGSDLEDDKGMGHRPHRCSVGGCGKDFKAKAQLNRHYVTAHGLAGSAGSPRPVMKTRTAFYLLTTPLTRLSRRFAKHIVRLKHAARAPYYVINFQAIKQECTAQMANKTPQELQRLMTCRKRNRGSVTEIATKLSSPATPTPTWLILTDKNMLPQPEVVAFPKPPTAPDGSLMYEKVPNKPEAEKIPLNHSSASPKRRTYDEMNGIDSSSIAPLPAKRIAKETPLPLARHPPIVPSIMQGGVGQLPVPLALQPPHEPYQSMMAAAAAAAAAAQQQHIPATPMAVNIPRHVSHVNGKPKIAQMTRSSSGRKQVISWMDAPDDLYFRATDTVKKMRRPILLELRRTARKPWRPIKNKFEEHHPVVVLD